MVNSDDFIKRLEYILEYYALSASNFADKIGVQRSSLSHLLSGRNKPSLDFVMKILEEFPEIDLYWILNGKGTFPKEKNWIETNESKTDTHPPTPISETTYAENLFEPIPNLNQKTIQDSVNEPLKKIIGTTSTGTYVEKIVMFYSDGTFSEYHPRSN